MQYNNVKMNQKRRAFIRVGVGTLAAGAVVSLVPSQVMAAKDPIYTGFFSSKAVGGYDPVAYFTEGKPVKGKKAFSLTYQDVQWLFSSQENLNTFMADPEKYAPQYGGYCAYAVGIGQVAKGDPDHWDIVDGKLYLNYDSNTRNLWLEKPADYIVQGDANWPKVLD